MLAAICAIFSPSMRTSARCEPVAFTTVPFLIRVPIRARFSGVGIWQRVFEFFRHRACSNTLVPCLRCEAIFDTLHGDAVRHGADERAEIATDALVLVDARDA